MGIHCTVTPAGTPLASPRKLAELKKAGVERIAVSLDGPDPVSHDAFRQVTGSFQWTMDIIRNAKSLDIELQVHTTLCRRTLPRMAEMADLADEIDPAVWAIFCLVPTGRAMASEELDAFTGKCGQCHYRAICGGSRSRAFVHHGDFMASDPACAYVPNASA